MVIKTEKDDEAVPAQRDIVVSQTEASTESNNHDDSSQTEHATKGSEKIKPDPETDGDSHQA